MKITTILPLIKKARGADEGQGAKDPGGGAEKRK